MHFTVTSAIRTAGLALATRTPMSPSMLFGTATVKLNGDTAPAWDALSTKVRETATGQRLADEEALRKEGRGGTHTDALLRLFDAKSEDDVRVTLYRDNAAWCPYCQKVWLLLEEKKIPFKVSKINMRSYGDKPTWFTNLVPGGFLPVIELDGKVITESLVIMQLLDTTFADQGPPMVPPADTKERQLAQSLLQLERQLFGAWCSLTFQPGKGIFDSNERGFLETLRKVDDALLATDGPWFLGGSDPSLVDLQYISHVERMIASVLYWKGLKLRNTGDFPGLDKWLKAFEERPSYLATKSDYYTHVRDIPPQYGNGFGVKEADAFAAAIAGKDGSWWQMPYSEEKLASHTIEPLAPLQLSGEDAARHEAAYKLTSNFKAVSRFAARGAGTPGGWSGPGKAELADPYAKPNEEYIEPVDACLRHVANALIDGADAAEAAAKADLKGIDANGKLADCLVYLRDRVGVPRDMGQAAAVALRSHLNWAIGLL